MFYLHHFEMCTAHILHFWGKSRWITGGQESHLKSMTSERSRKQSLVCFCFYTPFLHALLSFSRCVSNCESKKFKWPWFLLRWQVKNKTKKAEKTFQNFPLDGVKLESNTWYPSLMRHLVVKAHLESLWKYHFHIHITLKV